MVATISWPTDQSEGGGGGESAQSLADQRAGSDAPTADHARAGEASKTDPSRSEGSIWKGARVDQTRRIGVGVRGRRPSPPSPTVVRPCPPTRSSNLSSSSSYQDAGLISSSCAIVRHPLLLSVRPPLRPPLLPAVPSVFLGFLDPLIHPFFDRPLLRPRCPRGTPFGRPGPSCLGFRRCVAPISSRQGKDESAREPEEGTQGLRLVALRRKRTQEPKSSTSTRGGRRMGLRGAGGYTGRRGDQLAKTSSRVGRRPRRSAGGQGGSRDGL